MQERTLPAKSQKSHRERKLSNMKIYKGNRAKLKLYLYTYTCTTTYKKEKNQEACMKEKTYL